MSSAGQEGISSNDLTNRIDGLLDAGQFLNMMKIYERDYLSDSCDSEEDEELSVSDAAENVSVGAEKDVETLYNNLSIYELEIDKERFIELEKMLMECDDVIKESDKHLGSLESFKKTISLTFSESDEDDVEDLELLEICGSEMSKGDNHQYTDEEFTENGSDEKVLEGSEIIPAISNKISDLTKLLQVQLAETDKTYERLLGHQSRMQQEINENSARLDNERKVILAQLEDEKVEHQREKEEKEAAMCRWEEDHQNEVKEELAAQQIHIQTLEELIVTQKETADVLAQIQQDERKKREMKSAIKIQSTFRMHRTKKEYRIVQEKRRKEEKRKFEKEQENKRRQAEEEKIKREKEEEMKKEEKRKAEEEMKKKKAEEARRKMLDEEERKKREEEERKKKEEEKEREEKERKKREEEEKKKMEEEERMKREEEERKKKEEEERKKKEEEERKKKEEEERKKKEEERMKREVEEKKKKEEQEKKEREEEKRKKDAEERIKRDKEERRKKEEERIRKEEEERKMKENDERMKSEKDEEEARMKREEEEVKKRREEEEKTKEGEERKKEAEEEWNRGGNGETKKREEESKIKEVEKKRQKEEEKEAEHEKDLAREEMDEEKQTSLREVEEKVMSKVESLQKIEREIQKEEEEDMKTKKEEEPIESNRDFKMDLYTGPKHSVNVELKNNNIDTDGEGGSRKMLGESKMAADKKEAIKEGKRKNEKIYEEGVNGKEMGIEKNEEREGLKKEVLCWKMDDKDGENESIEVEDRNIKINDKVHVLTLSSKNDQKMNSVMKTWDSDKVYLQPLPQILNVRRLAWMENCLPWGKISNQPWIGDKKNHALTKPERKRPPSNKRLPKPLNEEVILSVTKCTSLTQVTSIHLKNLNGFTLTTLGQCVNLEYLSVNNCQLLTLDGLQICSQMKYIDVKNNNIEYVNVKEMESLRVLDLSYNNLALIHGLDDCSNLLWLNLQHNRITKFGSGLQSLRRLHTLLLGHNQLVSTSGLQVGGVELQTLDLSHNQLQYVTDIEKFCLLRSLDVSGNNLIETPNLKNHVLMQDLQLSDNCLSSLTELSECWLPLLRILNLGQNRLSALPQMEYVHSLKMIDIANNQLLDFAEIMKAFSNCKQMERFAFHGNPLSSEEEDMRKQMIGVFPRLRYWDSVSSNSCALVENQLTLSSKNSSDNGFQLLCAKQVDVFEKLKHNFHQKIKEVSESDLLGACNAHVNWCQESLRIAIECRYAHEYGEISASMFPSVDESVEQVQGAELILTDTDTSEMLSPQTGVPSEDYETLPKNQRVSVKRPNHLNSNQNDVVLAKRNKAATRIQAAWRGFSLRVKLQAALQFAQNVYDEESEFGEEIDLESFDMAEADLEKTWTVSDSPAPPTNFSVLSQPPLFRDSSHLQLGFPISHDESRSNPDENCSLAHPREAWNSPVVSARSNLPLSGVFRPKSTDVLRLSPPSTSTSGNRGDGDFPDVMSRCKDDEICKEWGFKDARTAQMMLQRAKKMKFNAERREKLKKLDPRQRLALFRKLGEVTPLMPVKSPSRKMLPKKEYFQARQQNMGLNIGYFEMMTKEEQNKIKESRTYKWIHTQISPFDNSDQRSQQSFTANSSQSSKKALDTSQRVILYQKHQVTGNGLFVGDTSEKSQSLIESECRTVRGQRRHSTPTSAKRPVHLPPIDRSSPSTIRREGSMSHWKPDVRKSGGWGGGKKRNKPKKSPNVSDVH